MFVPLTLLHSEWPKLHRVLAILSAVGLSNSYTIVCPPVQRGNPQALASGLSPM